MLSVTRFVTLFAVTMIVAQPVNAYGAEPSDAVTQERSDDVQVADACTPRISPRMAAAYGLPILTVPSRGCSRG